MNTTGIVVTGIIVVIIGVMAFMLVSANNSRTAAEQRTEILYDSINHAPITKTVQYVHDTTKAIEYRGTVKGTTDTEFVFVPTHDEIMTNVRYCDSILALISTPFNTEIQLDTDRHLWIEALPETKQFKYDFRQGAISAVEQIVTYTKTVTLPGSVVEENWWLDADLGYAPSPTVQLGFGFHTLGLSLMEIPGQHYVLGIRTHFGL